MKLRVIVFGILLITAAASFFEIIIAQNLISIWAFVGNIALATLANWAITDREDYERMKQGLNDCKSDIELLKDHP